MRKFRWDKCLATFRHKFSHAKRKVKQDKNNPRSKPRHSPPPQKNWHVVTVNSQWTTKILSSGPKRHFFIAILSNKNVDMPGVENGHQSAVSLCLFCWRVWVITINCRLQALSLHIILRGFRRVYKKRGLYPRGLKTEIENALYNKL